MFASVVPSRRWRGALFASLGVLIAGLLVLAPARSASAHDYLVESTPAANSTQTTPLKQVSLTFNDRVLDLSGDGSSALVQVIGPDRKHFETGCASILDRTVTAPVALGTGGDYTVTWQIVSADGHTVSDSVEFTYAPAAGTVAAEGRAGAPKCGEGESSSTTASSPAPTAAANDSGLGLVIGIGIGIGVLAVVGVVLVIVTGRRGGRTSSKLPPADD